MEQEPRLVTYGNDISKRWHVELYINQKRHRIYNGKILGLDLAPNRSRNRLERLQLIGKLYAAILDRIHDIDNMLRVPVQKSNPTVMEALDEAIEHKLKYPLSAYYKRDLKALHRQLVKWCKKQGLSSQPLSHLTARHLDDFLLQFNTGTTYYTSKRRSLSALLSVLVGFGYLDANPVKATTAIRGIETLHEHYTDDELSNVLTFLENGNQNLFLACLMSYGCLLRPHNEIRRLTRGELAPDLSYVSLAGERTKNGKLRKVWIPEFVKEAMVKLGIDRLDNDVNIFSLSPAPFNQYYFNTAWTRAKKKMLKAGIIRKKQTIYSFRHTAVIQLYLKSRSLQKVKQLMGHSSLTVTLTYLRSLGVEEGYEVNPVLPTAPKIK